MHFELIEYLFTYFGKISPFYYVVVVKPFSSTNNYPIPPSNTLVNTPFSPIGALNIETSKHVGLNSLLPVHKHSPLIQAPFLLQW